MTASRRLCAYLAGVTVVLGGIEVAARAGAPTLFATSHRALTKAATLDRHGPVDVLFFGTSRTFDGVSPRAFSQTLQELGLTASAFNLGHKASSLEILEYLVERFAGRPGMRLAVLELSEPQLEHATPNWLRAAGENKDLEDRLESWLRDHSKVVQLRSALRGSSLERLPAVTLLGPYLDGSEVMVTDEFRAALGRRDLPATDFDPSAWQPRRWAPAGAATSAEAIRLVEAAARLRRGGAQVVFVVPPLAKGADLPERHAPWEAICQEVASAADAAVWDFTAPSHADDRFADSSHLNGRGRAEYSKALGIEVAISGLLGRAGPAGGAR